jgi:uncharacterized repeat protein (TIGR03803 family)
VRPAIIARTTVRDAISPSLRITRAPARQIRLGLLCLTAGLAVVCPLGAALGAGPKLKDLFSFTNLRGAFPAAGLIADGAGNFYGTTTQGGKHGDGVVFELSPPAQGQATWTEKVLFSFNGTNGDAPVAGLIADGAGNLYGTTPQGGSKRNGVVFELSPPAQGRATWTEQVLLSFNGTDGYEPEAGLIADRAGNLYGTTYGGGANHGGVVFELSPPVQGQKAWTEQVLFSFKFANGDLPSAGLIMDGAGNLYGTTGSGGANAHGTVFELSPPAQRRAAWTEQVLFSFNGGTNGSQPSASLIVDGAGNLYGTTGGGGANNHGVVFELSPPAQGQTAWTEQVLSSFNGNNGAGPLAGLIADGAGRLYGTTYGGGAKGYGLVFELVPPSPGQTAWTEQVLSSFNRTNGVGPEAGLSADGAGNLYSTTYEGAKHGNGVVFELMNTGYRPPRL